MSEIQNFYANKCVLITGASGTVGKIVTEKLLRSCPDVKLVYVVMRAKLGKSARERLEEFLKSPVFAKLASTNPKALNKVVLVEGDLSNDDLGMDTVTRSILTNQVNIVLHVAANIKLNLPLVESLDTNYLGTKRILDLCLEMKRMDVFIFASSFTVYYDLKHLEEKADNFFVDVDNIKTLLKGKSGRELQELEEEICGAFGGTYMFAKTATETLVKSYAEKMPLAVVRLPAVGGCLNEPEPGFMDSGVSIAAFILGCGSGLLPCIMIDGNETITLLPADICVNGLLAVAWDVATERPPVAKYYNCVAKEPISFNQIFHYAKKSAIRNPQKEIAWYPGTLCIRNQYLYMLYFLFFVILPAQLLDLISMLQMKKPELTSALFMKHKRMSMFWGLKGRDYSRANMTALHKKMSFKDQNLFPTGEEYFDWSSYIDAYHRSMKKHILRTKDTEIGDCKKALRRAYWLDFVRVLYFPLLVLLILMLWAR